MQFVVLGLDETGDAGLVVRDFPDPVALAGRDDDLPVIKAPSQRGRISHGSSDREPRDGVVGVPAVRLQLSQHLRLEVDFEAVKDGFISIDDMERKDRHAAHSPAWIRQIVVVIIAGLIARSTGVGVRLEGHVGATQRLYECLWWCWVIRGCHDWEELVQGKRRSL